MTSIYTFTPRRHLLALASLALATAWSMPAQAGDACRMAVSSPEVDFGRMYRSALDGGNALSAKRTLTVSLTCQQPTSMALVAHGLSQDREHFIWGDREDAALDLVLHSATVDGRSVTLTRQPANGQAGTTVSGQRISWLPSSVILPDLPGPLHGSVFTAQLDVITSPMERHRGITNALKLRRAISLEAAGEHSDIEFSGEIVPAACTIQAGSGVVDFGDIPLGMLSREADNPLPPKQLPLSVQCDAPARFALGAYDERSGSASRAAVDHFGLNRDAREQAIGYYQLSLDDNDLFADGRGSLRLVRSDVNAASWAATPPGKSQFTDGTLLGVADLNGGSNEPVAVRSLKATLHLNATIAPTQTLDTSRETLLDGRVTVELFYL